MYRNNDIPYWRFSIAHIDYFLGQIEHVMVENLHKHRTGEVSWNTQPISLQIDAETKDNPEAYPITITLENNPKWCSGDDKREISGRR